MANGKGKDGKPPQKPLPVSATLHVIEGGGNGEPIEPDWKLIYKEALERHNAAKHWREILSVMRQAGTVTVANGSAIHRLVTYRLAYEKAEIDVIERGPTRYTENGQTYNLNFSVMRQCADECRQLEAALGLTPYHRARAGKVEHKVTKTRAADAYLTKKT